MYISFSNQNWLALYSTLVLLHLDLQSVYWRIDGDPVFLGG